MNSRHYGMDRQKREEAIKAIGYGTVIKSVVIDNRHRNGPEIHEISSTGIITIYNQRTLKVVTKLIARPNQLKRYFEVLPQELLEISIQHTRAKLNKIS